MKAHELLSAIRLDLTNLQALRGLQQLLFREILRTEKQIRALKSELKAIQSSGGNAAAKRSSYLKNRVEKVRQVAYTWRCFGDAIAFSYMDRFALKQCYYNTVNFNPKSDAGFLSDKSGALNEITLLENALANGLPALLVDLTNTIRHGDICIMIGPDPHLIEAKASGGLDRRGRRQRRSLELLNEFFETDRAEGLRGFPDARRVSFRTPERSYFDELRLCISEGIKNGYAARQPEKGLHYVVVSKYGPSVNDLVETLDFEAPWGFPLNMFKLERDWAPYLPFTLSIVDMDHLWRFIKGEIYIFVFVEIGRLEQVAAENGVQAAFDNQNNDYPLRVTMEGLEETAGISRHILARIGLEFASPEWLVTASIETMRQGIKIANAS